MKKKRTYNTNLIKKRRSYSLAEIAELLDIHIRTVQEWRKQGLSVIDVGVRPFLVMGEDLRQFLKRKMKKRKHSLNKGEFYCTKCKCPRKSKPEALSAVITNKRLGKSHRQAFIKGICSVCNQVLTLFSSDKKVKQMILLEPQIQINGNIHYPLNTDLTKDTNDES